MKAITVEDCEREARAKIAAHLRASVPKRRIHRRVVASLRNSLCSSARLADLDWSAWHTDHSFGRNYLHVRHKDKETWHRVYCRHAEQPMLAMENGRLLWVY